MTDRLVYSATTEAPKTGASPVPLSDREVAILNQHIHSSARTLHRSDAETADRKRRHEGHLTRVSFTENKRRNGAPGQVLKIDFELIKREAPALYEQAQIALLKRAPDVRVLEGRGPMSRESCRLAELGKIENSARTATVQTEKRKEPSVADRVAALRALIAAAK